METNRFMDTLAGSLALFLPDALHGQSPELYSLRGAGGGGSYRLFGGGCMPHISKDGNAYKYERALFFIL
jgi:hypothetical protein